MVIPQEWQAVIDCVDELMDAILGRYDVWPKKPVRDALEARLFSDIETAARAADREIVAAQLDVEFREWPNLP